MDNTEEQPDVTTGQAAALLSGAAAAAEQTVVPALQKALLEISEEPAFALEMSLFEGKDDAAIASVMNISEEDAHSLREEAQRQLLDTELGREVGQSGLSDMLELAGRYLRQESGSEQFRESLSKALETDERSVPERVSESVESLWKRIADELDATAEQLIGAGSVAIEGFGSARAMAASEEAEEEKRDYSFEIDVGHRYYGKLIREAADQWRIVFEVHSGGLEDVHLGYEIVSKEGESLHHGKVRLEKFSDEIYVGGEVIGALKVSDESTPPEVRAVEVEWKEED